ncbi:capsular biosynthesis protein [candidate division KSB1 bacterium]|nr:capsular biosynthesis protein [candidate division KSB1 bacterium]
MIDIHSHLLPGVDDGPQDFDEALEMLRGAEREGIIGVAATPHILDGMSPQLDRQIGDQFDRLKGKVEEAGIAVRLYLASEIYLRVGLEGLGRYRCGTYNGEKCYVLVEFPLYDLPPGYEGEMMRLLGVGLKPIVAHPERNLKVLARPEILKNLVNKGILFQINAGSLTGMFGSTVRGVAAKLLEAGWVHFIASDAHDPRFRPLKLKKARDMAAKLLTPQKADELVYHNPLKVISGKNLAW